MRPLGLGIALLALGLATGGEAAAEPVTSEGNPRNPSTPPQDVGWGEETTDEMCVAFLRVTVDAERLGHRPR